MGIAYNTSIVRDGLVLHLDAANPKSYPGSGVTWSDLSGNGNDGTLVNGVGYDSENNGSMTFDGNNNYVYSLIGNLPNEYSISIWVLASNFGNSISGFSDDVPTDGRHEKEFWINSDGTVSFRGYDGGEVQVTSNTNIVTDQYYCFTATAIDNDSVNLYVNAVKDKSSSIGTLYNGYSSGYFTIGIESDFTNYLQGKISNVQIYNRALSDAEIKQNYEALRGRYGI